MNINGSHEENNLSFVKEKKYNNGQKRVDWKALLSIEIKTALLVTWLTQLSNSTLTSITLECALPNTAVSKDIIASADENHTV